MTATGFEFDGSGGERIAAYRWLPEGEARAVVQIAHGMGEHAIRYHNLADALTARGFAVYANDHRGHGRTAPSAEALGDYGPGGSAAVVDDMKRLTERAAEEQLGRPIFLMGHSMGSMLGQAYLIEHAGLLSGAALSGSAAIDQLAGVAGRPGGLAAFNDGFVQRTGFEWLSRDDAEVDAYVADPLCGFSLNEASMISLFGQAPRLADVAALRDIGAGFPIYIFAGSDDPVNGKGAFIVPLIQRYVEAGLDVTARLYAGARHEVLNETNRHEVAGDLIDWIEKTLRKPA